MEVLKIRGGASLKGHVKAAGAKNAITKLLVASLLSIKNANSPTSPTLVKLKSPWICVVRWDDCPLGSESRSDGSSN